MDAIKEKEAELEALKAKAKADAEADATQTPDPEGEDHGDENEGLTPTEEKEIEDAATEKAEAAVKQANEAIARGVKKATAKLNTAEALEASFNIVNKLEAEQAKDEAEHLRLYLKAKATGKQADENNLQKFVATKFTADANSGVRQADDPGGGDLVPQAIRREIAWVRESDSWAFQNLTQMTVPKGTKSIDLPTADSVVVNWIGEGGTKDRSGEFENIEAEKPSFNKVIMTMHKFSVIIPYSNEMLDGAVVDLETFTREFGTNRIIHAIDSQLQSADTTAGRPAGLLSAGTTVSITQGAGNRGNALTEAQVVSTKAAHRTRAGRHAPMSRNAWYLIPQVYDNMSIHRAATTNALTYPQLSDGRDEPRILGVPVRQLPDAPDATNNAGQRLGMFGDLSTVLLGVSPDIEITASDQASYIDAGGTNLQSLFANDGFALRMIISVGIAVTAPNELSTLVAT